MEETNQNTKLELLAPAGNYQSFISALNSGADAIYLGLDGFNARGNIENFTRDNLKEVVSKAHLYGVKVYLTLNTLVKDEEFDDVISLVRFANECKVDAFIVQDIGLAYLLSNRFKGIELHASTQMGIENLEGAKFLERLGFTRVVLARETPLKEIKRIKNGTNFEIEYFIQGALCVGYSGNCYLCSLLAGASGNRGKCKQFCRLKYRINGGNEGYYLSTKDFCMLPSLEELTQSGVSSLKIEGRARRPAYVATVVEVYRKAIDNNFKFDEGEVLKLKKVFNRGDFISGYFKGEKIIYSNVQNHIGVKIGKVVGIKNGKRFNEITIESNHNLRKGDTLKFFDKDKEVMVVSPVDIKELGNNKYMFTSTSKAYEGLEVRLIVDSKLEENALKNEKKLPFSAIIDAKVNNHIKITLKSGNVEISYEGDENLVEAKNQPISENDILVAFSKCGDEFKLESFQCSLDNVFVRKSELNDYRRNALALFREKIINSNEKEIEVEENDYLLKSTEKAPKNAKKIAFFKNLDNLEALQKDYDYLVYSPNEYKKEELLKLSLNVGSKFVYLDLPLIVIKEDVEFFKEIFKSCGNLGVYATNYYALTLVSPQKTIIGSEMNVFNSYSLNFYIQNGFDKIVISKEDFDSESLVCKNAELFIDQRPPKLIYFKHCPFKEHFGGNCNNCKYRDDVVYSLGSKRLNLCRQKTISCHFYLKDDIVNKKLSRYGRVIEV